MSIRQLLRYFLRGCLVVGPVALTIYIVVLIITTLDQVLSVGVPGLGLVLTFALITLVGFLTSNVVGRALVDGAEHVFTRVPLVKLLYTSIKDLVSAFVGDRKRFNRPVAVTLLQDSQTHVLGFVTRDTLPFLGLPEHVAVYLPQSYNFAGNLVLVPAQQVHALDTASSELMTFIVSGGVSGFGRGQSLPPASSGSPTASTAPPS